MACSVSQTMYGFRRRTSRVEADQGVYVLWSCAGREGLSRVCDLSLGGLFMESPLEESFGGPLKLHFLADEGQIRASAEVRHAKPGQGLGLKFTSIQGEDCQHLAALLKRLRAGSGVCGTRAAV